MVKMLFWLVILLALCGIWKPFIAVILGVILIGVLLKSLRQIHPTRGRCDHER
jgi:hypothetical protein